MTAEPKTTDQKLLARWATREPVGSPEVLAVSLEPLLRTEVIYLSTLSTNEFWDLTNTVEQTVARSGVQSGQVTIHTPHTTTTIVVNEAETGFLNDFRRLIETLVSEGSCYEHDDHGLRTENLQEDEYVNGHSHCRALLVGHSSVTVPVVDGEILLGRWQRIMFVELDQARRRRAFVHVQGF